MDTKSLTIQSLKTMEKDAPGTSYAILQIKRGDEYHYKRFENYRRTIERYGEIILNDYDFKGVFRLETEGKETDADLLEEIYRLWNMPTRPTGIRFTGHSLSVSDIIALCRDDRIRFFFCDSYGFRELETESESALQK